MTPEIAQPDQGFNFSEREQLYERISDERFKAFLTHEATTVHQIEFSSNNYGEFLFVTMSRKVREDRVFTTFWGLGYHESRERWLTQEWRYYATTQMLHQIPQKIAPEDAQALVDARREEISPYVGEDTQTERGKLFEMLADLTDEDGAYTELEDLGWPEEDLE